MTMAVTAAYRRFSFQLNQLSRTGRLEILLNKDENVRVITGNASFAYIICVKQT